MRGTNILFQEKCASCGSINLDENEDMNRCLDCGMGKYKAGRHKGVR